MASTTLRAAGVVCAALIAGATAPALAAPAPPALATAAAPPAAPSPSPDPFEGLTADQIGEKAVTATQSATSLRMAGRVVSGGQPLDVDFAVNDRSECTGAIKLRGGAAELRQTSGVTYMKGDEAFWRASMTSQGLPPAQIDATIELLKGRWLKIPQGRAGTEGLSGVCDLKALLADLGKDKKDRTGLVRGPDGEVNGTPVATLVKKKTGGETTTVSVAQSGKPYILRTVKTGGGEPGSVTLSDYDKPVKVVVPPADETVDLSKLDPGTAT
ncbi:hypothetical protein [Streptomyces roseicoloratus]|uniref:hypothetical protein n=1 Tax=Streptomyces roseicoloratus TaxID=2508722 RepID=UPI001009B1B9|nr:hypothetical protein [Streptomyces roseicoloratus]